MQFTILGCGSSMGVPRSDGFFGNCDPKNKKNYRTRCSVLIQTQSENVLIDTSPDLRQQLIKNKVKKIDKVFYSHMHADQTHGINDLRVFYIQNKKTIPVYANSPTRKYLLDTFKYCFVNYNKEYPATLKLNSISKNMIINDGKKKIKIRSVKVRHGSVDSICYIIDKKIAYISDISEFSKKDFKYFKNLNYLVIDCLWFRHHPSHLNYEKCLNYLKIFKPKKTILTNLHTDMDYNSLLRILPKNIKPAYDNMKIKL
jgi:phosphoribosyl 1,2-cyclic phosphate phosphodiesterase